MFFVPTRSIDSSTKTNLTNPLTVSLFRIDRITCEEDSKYLEASVQFRVMRAERMVGYLGITG